MRLDEITKELSVENRERQPWDPLTFRDRGEWKAPAKETDKELSVR